MTFDEMAGAYINARNTIKSIEDEYEARLSAMKAKQDELSTKILADMNAAGIDSVKTVNGTISRRVSERFGTSDWGKMYEFILENAAPELLERRINVANMRDFLENNPNLEPAGLVATRSYTITVRKPSLKKDL